jgi:uncharacterized membrane protein
MVSVPFMSIAPILAEGPYAVIHTILALSAFLVGLIQLARRKGGPGHRRFRRAWVGIMALVALTSFPIHTMCRFGPFSAIHLLSLFTLLAPWDGVRAIRRGDLRRHAVTVPRCIGDCGAFTFLPDHAMHDAAFGVVQK